MIIEVAIPCPLHRTFDYRVSLETASFEKNALIGMRVRVPFGRRVVIGIVVATKKESALPLDKLKNIDAFLDQKAIIPPDLMALALWISQYYHAAIGEVFSLILPARLRKGEALIEPTITTIAITDAGVHWLTIKENQRARVKQNILIFLETHLQSEEALKEHDLLKAFPTFKIHTKTLLAEQLITLNEKVLETNRTFAPIAKTTLSLHQEQQIAVDAVKLKKHTVYALEGITGSGKTAVYIEIAKKAINDGQQVLVLVPEIGLTPQFVARIAKEITAPHAIIHSNLTEKQRYDAWQKAASQEVALIIGTRSALFTPFLNLGLIIIDEAHDSSYRQRDGVRYSAHDSAIKRAALLSIPIVLGSATPTLETIHNIQLKRFEHLQLLERAKGTLPNWNIIDCRNEPQFDGLTMTLLNEIEATLDRSEQVLLFLNRRGYSPVLMCESCGYVPDCIHCSAHLNVHRARHQLSCHHCGYKAPLPDLCPDCGQKTLKMLGVGTQRIEKSLADAFPKTNILRFDRDNIRTKDQFERYTEQIENNHANIIIGTQMLAKGHDFENITLVALVDTDGLLFSTDFRAEEKLAQILMQVSGRSGRATKPGKVMVQTHFPDHDLFVKLPRIGYHQFARKLLTMRKQLSFPPFSHQVLLQIEARSEASAEQSLNKFLNLGLIDRSVIELTPVLPNVLSKRQGFYRFHTVLQSRSRSELHKTIHHLLHNAQRSLRSNVRLICEVDPIDIG